MSGLYRSPQRPVDLMLVSAAILCPRLSSPPQALDPLLEAADDVGDNGVVRLLVNSYVNIIDRARYAGREPDEEDAMACDKLVDAVRST